MLRILGFWINRSDVQMGKWMSTFTSDWVQFKKFYHTMPNYTWVKSDFTHVYYFGSALRITRGSIVWIVTLCIILVLWRWRKRQSWLAEVSWWATSSNRCGWCVGQTSFPKLNVDHFFSLSLSFCFYSLYAFELNFIFSTNKLVCWRWRKMQIRLAQVSWRASISNCCRRCVRQAFFQSWM